MHSRPISPMVCLHYALTPLPPALGAASPPDWLTYSSAVLPLRKGRCLISQPEEAMVSRPAWTTRCPSVGPLSIHPTVFPADAFHCHQQDEKIIKAFLGLCGFLWLTLFFQMPDECQGWRGLTTRFFIVAFPLLPASLPFFLPPPASLKHPLKTIDGLQPSNTLSPQPSSKLTPRSL